MSDTKQEEKDWRFYPRPEVIRKMMEKFRDNPVREYADPARPNRLATCPARRSLNRTGR